MTHYLQIYILERENDIKSSSYHPKKKRKEKRNNKTWQKHKKCLAPTKLTLVVFTET